MTAMETIQQLRSLGISVRSDGENLLCSPKDRLTDEHRDAIRQHKTEIIRLILIKDPQRDRETTRDELMKVYEAIGQKYTKGDWSHLVALPSWKVKLDELEATFTEAWEQGRDAWNEFESLRDHWREGLRKIKENSGN